MTQQLFQDRKEATSQLLRMMAAKDVKLRSPLVIGIAKGGAAVAYYIAKSLQCHMEVLVCGKLSSPNNPEFGFGAVTFGRTAAIDHTLAGQLALSDEETTQAITATYDEVQRLSSLYRKDMPFPAIAGHDVVLADDGLTTGYTMLAAVRWIKTQNPASVTVAVPVASEKALKLVRHEADHAFAAQVAMERFDLGDFYREIKPMTDEDVLRYIERSRFNTN
jgi:predicted phosphoribosyltransferase